MSLLDRVKPHAFVCEGGVVHLVRTEGSLSLAGAVAKRPSGCRWMVSYHTADYPTGQFRLVDLYDLEEEWVSLSNDKGGVHWTVQIKGVGHYEMYPNKDAAIAAGVLKGQDKPPVAVAT